MMRALIELLITIVIVIGARAVLKSLFSGITQAVNDSQARPPAGKTAVAAGGELHKDPVCGTYVTASTQFQRQSNSQTFYYCSAACRERHRLATAKVG